MRLAAERGIRPAWLASSIVFPELPDPETQCRMGLFLSALLNSTHFRRRMRGSDQLRCIARGTSPFEHGGLGILEELLLIRHGNPKPPHPDYESFQ
jgi:hypothetical protein